MKSRLNEKQLLFLWSIFHARLYCSTNVNTENNFSFRGEIVYATPSYGDYFEHVLQIIPNVKLIQYGEEDETGDHWLDVYFCRATVRE